MAEQELITKTVTFDELQDHLDQLVQEVAKGDTRIAVERDGEVLINIEPISPEQREINELMKDPRFRELAAISEAVKHLPLDEMEREIKLGLQEGRERRRKERERLLDTRQIL